MRHIIIILSLIATTFFVTSCNTFEGLGKDIKKGGEKLEDVAADNK